MTPRVLVVDDEPLYRHGLLDMLRASGIRADAAADGEEALRLFQRGAHQLVISDLSMPRLDGLALLAAVKRSAPATRFVLLTGVGSVSSAVRAVRDGADDFLEKPISREQLAAVLARASEPDAGAGIVTDSPVMREMLDRARRIATTDATLLIQGESGTGKELVARAIHGWSRRAEAPFVAVNCAALPETLVEAELFGHERGAFTDARVSRAGVIEQADGGTLFLDEIGEMPAAAQAKLLRVLQDRCVRRLGAAQTREVNVRFVAATNQTLREMVRQHRFREDLYYRLDVVALELPPLRERPEDIPLLARHFLDRYAGAYGRADVRLTPAALATLAAHRWPGNVRELENTIHRALLDARDGDIDAVHVAIQRSPVDAPAGPAPEALAGRSWDSVEKDLILATLARVGGNRRRAAELMGMGERTLRNRLREYRIAAAEAAE